MYFPPRQVVNRVKEQFPSGCRVELTRWNDPYRDIPLGTKGTVTSVDDVGTIHVTWDTGQHLGVALGEDECRRVDENE